MLNVEKGRENYSIPEIRIRTRPRPGSNQTNERLLYLKESKDRSRRKYCIM